MSTKNAAKFWGIIALAAVIGFGVTGCEQPTDSTGKTLTGIMLNTDSVKKAYIQNETLNLSGLVVTAAYNDGSSVAVAEYTANPASGTTLSAIETKVVTVSYTEGAVTKTADFSVTVTAVVLDSITAAYTGGQVEINSDVDDLKTYLTVTAHYNNGSTQTPSNYSLSGTLTTIGEKTITASYTDGDVIKTDTFTVTVVCTNHDWQWKPSIPATCTTAGSEIQTCSLCGITGETRQTSIDPNAHDYQWLSTATATTDGTEILTCTHNNIHTSGTVRLTYATGTAGLSFTAISIDGGTNNAYCVSRGSVSSGTVHIPAYHRPDANSPYLPVMEIMVNAFYYLTDITSITIPTGVTSIGSYAFAGCSNIASITLPASVTSIGDFAFGNCTGLTNMTIPEGVTSISNRVFSGCNGLASITIPEGVTSIGREAFYWCSSLTSITIPEGITSIDNGTFSNCRGLTSVTIGSGVTSIGDYAFYYCTSLTSVTIPEDVTSIGDYAFYWCSSLASITLPESLTTIGNSAFYWCSSLASITIPTGVTSIDNGTFGNCSSLTSVTIGSGVTSIGDYAFYRCSGLASITIPASVTSIIGEMAFAFCSSLTSVTFNGTIASDSFSNISTLGDLRVKFYATDSANGTPGTYTRPTGTSTTWTLQP